ncbi:MAG: ATP-dependent protease LonB [Clostridia bacterium]|nr:ATP-dependent protease LonB [Clostridia bacterium]
MLSAILMLIQLTVTIVVGIYFFRQLRSQRAPSQGEGSHSAREMAKLQRLRAIRLAEPLAERVRPGKFSEVIGQEEGVRSLKAILCGANPQHVLIYGPPGVGKTCAARLALEAARMSPGTPFAADAPFVEVDATCVRFDERAIADPLIGSVHDPIYQGAGPMGAQGVPQPKPGAVTKAHGGVLFLDEIGEMHPVQMGKLLKVLEDRKVMLESAYYDPDMTGVPAYIRDIFRNGLPADFRLIGATTRSPQEISPALRSRCMEVFFRALTEDEVAQIAAGAAERAGFAMAQQQAQTIGRYAACGRDAVNIVQMAAGLAQMETRHEISETDVAWVLNSGHYAPRPPQRAEMTSRVGCVHGLAVTGDQQGALLDVEAVVTPGEGRVTVTGIIEEEELGQEGRRIRRKSTARGSAENVRTMLAAMGHPLGKRDLHLNFPGGAPVDGPSAGVAMALAALSAMTGQAVDGRAAVTGEITVQGRICAVGGVAQKVEAARRAGLTRVFIPRENEGEAQASAGVEIVGVTAFAEVASALLMPAEKTPVEPASLRVALPLAAQGEVRQPASASPQAVQTQ